MEFGKKKKLVEDFYNAFDTNTLPNYYNRYLGNGTNDDNYKVAITLTHKNFCSTPTMSHGVASKMSIAANAITSHASHAFSQKKISSYTHELAQREAALLEPDNIEIVDAWKKSMHGISQNVRKNVLEQTNGMIHFLEIEDTYLSDAVSERMEVLRDNMDRSNRKKIMDAKKAKEAAAAKKDGPAPK